LIGRFTQVFAYIARGVTIIDKASLDTLRVLIDHIKSKTGLSTQEILEQLEGKETRETIPISIFNPELGALESIVKYLVEEEKMQHSEIAKILNRDLRTIWSTYDKAKKKLSGKLDTTSEIKISPDIFASRKLSVLESLVHFLHEELGMSLRDIARKLQRNDSTIWTVNKRAQKKLESEK